MSNGITDDMVQSIRSAARKLTGYRRCGFQVEIALKYRDGSARKAERVFGWRRSTVELVLNELSTGVKCIDNTSARGRKKTEEESPRIVQKAREIVKPHAQADPKFQTTLAYARITAARRDRRWAKSSIGWATHCGGPRRRVRKEDPGNRFYLRECPRGSIPILPRQLDRACEAMHTILVRE